MHGGREMVKRREKAALEMNVNEKEEKSALTCCFNFFFFQILIPDVFFSSFGKKNEQKRERKRPGNWNCVPLLSRFWRPSSIFVVLSLYLFSHSLSALLWGTVNNFVWNSEREMSWRSAPNPFIPKTHMQRVHSVEPEESDGDVVILNKYAHVFRPLWNLNEIWLRRPRWDGLKFIKMVEVHGKLLKFHMENKSVFIHFIHILVCIVRVVFSPTLCKL